MKARSDSQWMDAAARLAARARPISGRNPGVASILVKDGHVLATGWTREGGRPHAEADALSRLAPGQAKGATFYVTLEPCAHQSDRGPACSDLLSAQGLARVVIGQLDPDPRTAGKGIAKLEAAGVAVTLLDHTTAWDSVRGFLTRQTLGRPYVTLKLAQSLDGRLALADGTSEWITGETARAHCHAMRARHEAILVGGGTWRADSPRLDVRLPGLEDRSPQRVILTRGVQPDSVRVINTPQQISQLEGINHLYIEGGAATAASFLQADLVDELHLYQAPIIIGADGLGTIGTLGLTDLAALHGRWREADTRPLGSDRFTAYRRTRN